MRDGNDAEINPKKYYVEKAAFINKIYISENNYSQRSFQSVFV